jgi:hypothetical protein
LRDAGFGDGDQRITLIRQTGGFMPFLDRNIEFIGK